MTAVDRFRVALAVEKHRRTEELPVGTRRLSTTMGIEIVGTDLARLGPSALARLKELLLEHKLLIVRGQDLSTSDQVRVSRALGSLDIHPMLDKARDRPELIEFVHNKTSPGFENVWHADQTWALFPPQASLLYCKECPAGLGDTLWANMAAALDTLPPEVVEDLRGAAAVHTYAPFFRMMRLKGATPDEIEAAASQHPDQVHPVVLTHPHTGDEILFVNELWTKSVEGPVTVRELTDRAKLPELQVRVRWEPGTVAIWDNLATQHYAANDYYPYVRRMRRATVRELSRL